MRIGEFSRQSGLSIDTLRYYEKIGLFPTLPRDAGGRRVYDESLLVWVRFLERLKATGMGVRERVHYAALREQGATSAGERRALLEKHRTRVAEDIERLSETLKLLDDKVAFYQKIEAGEKTDPVSGLRSDALAQGLPHHSTDK